MALGAVQSEYAGTAYAYRRTTGTAEKFSREISAAAQMTEEDKNSGRIPELISLPYGNAKDGYEIKAQYAPESTPEHPVIQVSSNYGGKWNTYKVNVNDVDPQNASQLEMFALLSYSDDQGALTGKSTGSYQQLKAYADNAQMNGYWEGNQDWDSFANAKHDWISIMNRMTDDYSQAGLYSQYLNGQKLVETLSHFHIQHVDFDQLRIEDKSADMFFHYELNIPPNIMKAWLEVAAECGSDGMDNDRFSHMTSVMIRRFSKYQEENPEGDPIEAALKAAKEALCALEYPLTLEMDRITGIQKELEEERIFYQSFIQKLEELKEPDKTEANLQNTGTSEASTEPGTTEILDFMKYLRERMKEIFVLIQNNDTEASFQIGGSSFTVKEWKEFLKKFDSIEEVMKELMREEMQKRDDAQKTETAAEDIGGIDALVSESTKTSFPSPVHKQENIMYITWYTQEGIFCRKAGQSEGYEWSVPLKNEEDYCRVMELLDRFDNEESLQFAAHKTFWQDFLNGKINPDSISWEKYKKLPENGH